MPHSFTGRAICDGGPGVELRERDEMSAFPTSVMASSEMTAITGSRPAFALELFKLAVMAFRGRVYVA